SCYILFSYSTANPPISTLFPYTTLFRSKKYGDECVEQGTYSYGAVAKKSNNCSRFITRMFMKSSERFHFWHGINLPETIKSSPRSEEHTSELQSRFDLVCRLLLEKKKTS